MQSSTLETLASETYDDSGRVVGIFASIAHACPARASVTHLTLIPLAQNSLRLTDVWGSQLGLQMPLPNGRRMIGETPLGPAKVARYRFCYRSEDPGPRCCLQLLLHVVASWQIGQNEGKLTIV